MSNNVRDALFSHEMYSDYFGNAKYPVSTIRMHEPMWDFSCPEIESELAQMKREGLVECYDEVWWEATINGWQYREKRWQELSLRHPALISQDVTIEILILALVASSNNDSEGENNLFLEDALPIYLWKISIDDIRNVVRSLIESDHIKRLLVFNKSQLYLTANGRIQYARRIIAELGLVPPETILTMVEAPSPTFLDLELPPELADNLTYRWQEAMRCQKSRAWLAATIIFGSILEALLSALLKHHETLAIDCDLAPQKDNQMIPIGNWTLNQMLKVAASLDLIDPTLRSYGDVLRNSRNLVHPDKQLRERSIPTEDSVQVSQTVIKAIVNSFLLRMHSGVINGDSHAES